jgi:hypothetical protein
MVIGLGVQRIADILLEQSQRVEYKGDSDKPGRRKAATLVGTRAAPGNIERKPPGSGKEGRKLGSARTDHALNSSEDFRKYRGDVVAHYPFVDSTGSVASLLKENLDRPESGGDGPRLGRGDEEQARREQGAPPEPSVLSVPAPQGRRMMRRAFDEFRVGRDSLRVADIPAALQVLSTSCSDGYH